MRLQRTLSGPGHPSLRRDTKRHVRPRGAPERQPGCKHCIAVGPSRVCGQRPPHEGVPLVPENSSERKWGGHERVPRRSRRRVSASRISSCQHPAPPKAQNLPPKLRTNPPSSEPAPHAQLPPQKLRTATPKLKTSPPRSESATAASLSRQALPNAPSARELRRRHSLLSHRRVVRKKIE